MIFGTHPVTVDAVCAALIGFDPYKIPIIRQAFACDKLPVVDWTLSDVRARIASNAPALRLAELPGRMTVPFTPHFGWTGHVEYDTEVAT